MGADRRDVFRSDVLAFGNTGRSADWQRANRVDHPFDERGAHRDCDSDFAPTDGVAKSGANRWILGIGILDTGAYVFNNYGMRLEQISVVSVLASLIRSRHGGIGGDRFRRKGHKNPVARHRGDLRRHRSDQPVSHVPDRSEPAQP